VSHLTLGLFAQYHSSNLDGYQFLNQETFYSLFLVYTLLDSQYVMYNVLNCLYEFHCTRFIKLIVKLLPANHFIIREKTKRELD
jgi:hypothetical protein